MSSDNQAFRAVRVTHLMMIVSVSALIAMGEWIRGQNGASGVENLGVIHKAFLVVLVSLLGAIMLVRTRVVAPAAEAIRDRREESAWHRWRGGNITSFVLCESIALFGFALRFLGGELIQSAPFYAVGLALLVFFFPRNPASV